MLLPSVLAALLAASPALAQTSTISICFTALGFSPAKTSIRTLYEFFPYTTTAYVNVTTQSTVTVTPDATTFTDIAVTTTTISTTTTFTPSPITIPTPARFAPLLQVAQTPVVTDDTPIFSLPTITPTGGLPSVRFARHLNDPIDGPQELQKRQTPANNTAGYYVDENGNPSGLRRTYPRRVRCNVSIFVTTTSTSTITASPATVTAPQVTATLLTTRTVSTTTTIIQSLLPKTIYAACAANNVVNHITDRDGHEIVLNEVVYRPREGFPLANELRSTPDTAIECCVACQKAPNCAGSFYFAHLKQCHLRFTTVAPTANYTGPAVCDKGSGTLFLGTIFGQRNHPKEYALTFSNGPCGRYGWSARSHDHSGHKGRGVGM
ncbi:hypothetical protein EJ04DRAFT_545379 [Polyplosphaeria fusca]|uniref:Apple domain-containing protein n=1 Tax=Polyplosphaeria fusca TaxID=682080 RepID=A0A9P4QRF1_9PLEO|nr:hypothetical protein EJ04DRAFT_545379 [Polyplosphaeria fusca]